MTTNEHMVKGAVSFDPNLLTGPVQSVVGRLNTVISEIQAKWPAAEAFTIEYAKNIHEWCDEQFHIQYFRPETEQETARRQQIEADKLARRSRDVEHRRKQRQAFEARELQELQRLADKYRFELVTTIEA